MEGIYRSKNEPIDVYQENWACLCTHNQSAIEML